MQCYDSETVVTEVYRVWSLVEADSEEEAREKAMYGQYDEQNRKLVSTINIDVEEVELVRPD